MADTIIRAPVNTAGQTEPFRIIKEALTVYLYPQSALTATEFADLQREDSAGNWADVFDSNFGGSTGQVRLESTTVTEITIRSPGNYRLDFDDPTNAVGAAIVVP